MMFARCAGVHFFPNMLLSSPTYLPASVTLRFLLDSALCVFPIQCVRAPAGILISPDAIFALRVAEILSRVDCATAWPSAETTMLSQASFVCLYPTFHWLPRILAPAFAELSFERES